MSDGEIITDVRVEVPMLYLEVLAPWTGHLASLGISFSAVKQDSLGTAHVFFSCWFLQSLARSPYKTLLQRVLRLHLVREENATIRP